MRHHFSYFRKSGIWTILLIAISSLSLPAQMTAEMAVDLKSVRQAALSPDGQKVAYVLRIPRGESEAPGIAYSEIWMTDINGAAPVQYTAKPASASALSWSADGKQLYFLSKIESRNPVAQVYALPVNGGVASPVTNHSAAVSAYSFSPDGKWLAYISLDDKSDKEKAAEAAGEDWIIPDTNFKFARLWLMNTASGESKSLLSEDLYVRNIYWSPDNKTIVFRATATPLVDDDYVFSKIYKTTIDGGKAEVFCETEGKLGGMGFSPDGSQFAFLGATDLSDPLAQSLFVAPGSGGTAKNLTEGAESSTASFTWLDNKQIVLLSNKGCLSDVSLVDTKSGKAKSIYLNSPILSSIAVHGKSKQFVSVANATSHPSEVYAGSLKDGKLKRLTNHNPQLAETRLAKQEVIEWKGADGWRMEGVLTYPLNYQEGTAYPLALQIHGGPEGVSQHGWRTRATYPVQVLAANGYMVLEPNYRGSGGRGVAFSKADHDDLGGKEFEDVLAGIDALVARGMVDNDQVCTGGWSYGGYFSAWAATRYSKRFKASMVAAGLTNWISFSGTTDIPHEMALVHWNSYWYQERDLHWERSPLYHIQDAETPTLVVHGLKDDRVHPEQSMQLYAALKHNDVPSKLILYPREPHGLTERAHSIHYIKNLLAWYNKYTLKQSAKKAPEKVIN